MGIDPGETTGVAVMQENILIFEAEAGTTWKVIDWIESFNPEVVVVENFFIRRGRPCNYHAAIKMIGVIEYFCDELKIKHVLQSPSILTIMKRWVPGSIKSPHTKSAIAHLMYYLKLQHIEVSL